MRPDPFSVPVRRHDDAPESRGPRALLLRDVADQQDTSRFHPAQEVSQTQHLHFVPVRQVEAITDRPDPVVVKLRKDRAVFPLDEGRVSFRTNKPDDNPSHNASKCSPGRRPGCTHVPNGSALRRDSPR